MNAIVAIAVPPTMAAGIVRLVRFELWRFRWLALLSVALEIARAVFIEWAMHLAPPVIGEQFGGAFGTNEVALLDEVLWLATVLVTAVLVQADLPSDDHAFWRTRPIAPVGLALAKLTTFVLLFVVAPAAINMGRLVAYGAPLHAVGAATLQLAVGAGSSVVPAWGLAIVTRTLLRFAIGGVAVLVGSQFAFRAALYWAEVWSGRGGSLAAVGMRGVLDWQGLGVHGWWFAAGVTAAAAGILTWHYEHRRTARSTAAAAALFVVSWLLPGPRDVSAPPALARLVAERLDVASLTLPSARQIASGQGASFPVPVGIHLELPGLPGDVSAAVTLRHPTLRAGGIVAVGDGSLCCLGNGEAGAFASALPRPRPTDDRPQIHRQGFPIAAKDADALRERTVTLEADAEVALRRHRWIGTIPLRPGAAFRSGSQSLEVLAYEPTLEPTYVALVRYTEFPTLARPESWWVLFAGDLANTPSVLSNWGPSTPATALTNRPSRWASGRRWVGRFHVVVEGAAQLGPKAQIYVVEARALGAVRVPITRPGLRVSAPGNGASAR